MDRKFALFVNHGQLEGGKPYASLQVIDVKPSKLAASMSGRLGRQSATFKLTPVLVEKLKDIELPALVDLELEFLTTSKGLQAQVVDIFPVAVPKEKSFQSYLDSLVSLDSKSSTVVSTSTSSSLPPLPPKT